MFDVKVYEYAGGYNVQEVGSTVRGKRARSGKVHVLVHNSQPVKAVLPAKRQYILDKILRGKL